MRYYRRLYGKDSDAFGKRRTFEDGGDLVADSPSLVGENNGVHELVGPRIFNLECLLIFHGLRRKGAEDWNKASGLEVLVEASSDGLST